MHGRLVLPPEVSDCLRECVHLRWVMCSGCSALARIALCRVRCIGSVRDRGSGSASLIAVVPHLPSLCVAGLGVAFGD